MGSMGYSLIPSYLFRNDVRRIAFELEITHVLLSLLNGREVGGVLCLVIRLGKVKGCPLGLTLLTSKAAEISLGHVTRVIPNLKDS